MNGHGPPRTASTALGSPQASYAGRRSDSRIGRQSPLPPKPFNRQPSISTRRTRHPPEYSHSLGATAHRAQPATGHCVRRNTAARRTQPDTHLTTHNPPHATGHHPHHQTPRTTPDATRRNPSYITRCTPPSHTPPHPAAPRQISISLQFRGIAEIFGI